MFNSEALINFNPSTRTVEGRQPLSKEGDEQLASPSTHCWAVLRQSRVNGTKQERRKHDLT